MRFLYPSGHYVISHLSNYGSTSLMTLNESSNPLIKSTKYIILLNPIIPEFSTIFCAYSKSIFLDSFYSLHVLTIQFFFHPIQCDVLYIKTF